MSYSFEINKLVSFIENHSDFNVIRSNSCFYNNHLGAVLADIGRIQHLASACFCDLYRRRSGIWRDAGDPRSAALCL